ncbi:hypothetical protein RSK20926_15832 [Roseobacter sp. SK209-2-6]|uniref:hypothetical protein n=1 Tax=Roseobacter sp. SK209-2-6 TaxID=388739 RepID=UPI0000F3CC73|nr:hypothetical protein [Roseobacter sp. SK209-2-6]EBA14336.1 hypothetical protein RSK20926_15832 [Roseobacter sp. SK209-2-6]
MSQTVSQNRLWKIINLSLIWPQQKSSTAAQADLQDLARSSLRHLPEHLLRDIGL